MKKLIWILIVIVAVVGLTFALRPQQQGTSTIQESSNVAAERQPVVREDYVKYYGADGRNAFELLQEITQVEFKKYDFGVFIESINGVKPDSKHFWKLYVNGEEAQVGADQLQTKNSDVIEWKIEEIRE